LKKVLPWILPGGLVLGLAVGVTLWAPPEALADGLTRYRWIVYGSGFLLSWGFHRSRVAVACAALAAADVVLARAVGASFPVGAAALAWAFGGLVLSRDRGVLSVGGALQGVAVFAGLAVAGLLFSAPANAAAFEGWAPLPGALTGWTGIPQATLLASGLALLPTLYAAVRWEGPVERGVLWAQLTLLAGASDHLSPAGLFPVAAALTLTISILETSYAMAYRDDLTGLPARRALVRDLAALGGTFTLAMVDVDHFKKFNDKHGHDVGDQVLKLVASRLAAAPGGGKAYRYGGEEFTIVYPGRVRADAAPHLEAVRAAVEGASFSVRSWKRPKAKPTKTSARPRAPKKLSVTVSIGMADTTGKDPTPEAVLKKADQALYRAKKKGRNRVSK
jgi:diguanylate cyclase (GGDEF)-like protein